VEGSNWVGFGEKHFLAFFQRTNDRLPLSDHGNPVVLARAVGVEIDLILFPYESGPALLLAQDAGLDQQDMTQDTASS
jgi:hypothetical protein